MGLVDEVGPAGRLSCGAFAQSEHASEPRSTSVALNRGRLSKAVKDEDEPRLRLAPSPSEEPSDSAPEPANLVDHPTRRRQMSSHEFWGLIEGYGENLKRIDEKISSMHSDVLRGDDILRRAEELRSHRDTLEEWQRVIEQPELAQVERDRARLFAEQAKRLAYETQQAISRGSSRWSWLKVVTTLAVVVAIAVAVYKLAQVVLERLRALESRELKYVDARVFPYVDKRSYPTTTTTVVRPSAVDRGRIERWAARSAASVARDELRSNPQHYRGQRGNQGAQGNPGDPGTDGYGRDGRDGVDGVDGISRTSYVQHDHFHHEVEAKPKPKPKPKPKAKRKRTHKRTIDAILKRVQ